MQEMEPVSYKEFIVGDSTFRIPESGYVYSNTDLWARVNGNTAIVGFSDLIRFDPRELVSLRPPDIGDEVRIFEKLCSFETDQVSLDAISPVSGKVLSVNEDLLEDPALVKKDPYERGWVAEIELLDLDGDLDCLMGFEEYVRFAQVRVEAGPQIGCPCTRLGSKKKGPS